MRYDIDNISLRSYLGREQLLVALMNERADQGWRLTKTIPVGMGGIFPSPGGALLVWERSDGPDA
jgi:hypothetical protein